MRRLWQFLWSGCFHVWEERHHAKLEDAYGNVGVRVICACAKCGKPKKFDLI
jgi:hypothetical protein